MSPKSPLHELRRDIWPVQEPELEARRRERIATRIVTLNRELGSAPLRRRPLAWLAAAALIAGASGIWLVAHAPDVGPGLARSGEEGVRLVAGAASVSRAGVLAPLGDGPLDVSAEPVVVTRLDQDAELRLGSNTALHLDAASEVGLERRTIGSGIEERVHLRSGGVALRVPKLGDRGKVAVETRDSWIEVHGTRFSVRWIEHAREAPFTQVDVTEGKVLVRAHDGAARMLGPGDSWHSNDAEPASAAPPSPSEPAASSSTPVAPPPPTPTPVPRSQPQPKPQAEEATAPDRPLLPPTPSELAAQNRLLEGAELARKNGMSGLALQRLDTLIARYPNAELAHNARVQRLRLLRSLGRSEDAATAARQYLQLYPQGFARQEAQQALSDTPSSAEGREGTTR